MDRCEECRLDMDGGNMTVTVTATAISDPYLGGRDSLHRHNRMLMMTEGTIQEAICQCQAGKDKSQPKSLSGLK